MTSGVYGILNIVAAKVYIGSSIDIAVRIVDQHVRYLNDGTHWNARLQRAWNRDGRDAFVFVLVEECAPEDRFVREQWYLDNVVRWGIDYNVNRNADVPPSRLGIEWDEEQRQRIRERLMGHGVSEETRRKIGDANRIHGTGRVQSDETKRRRAASLREYYASNTKPKDSNETRQRRSDAQKRVWARKTGRRGATNG